MKPAAYGLAAATLAAALAFAPGPGLAQTTSTETKTPGMAAPAGQGTASGMTPGTPAGTAAASGNTNQAVATTQADATTPAHGHNSFTAGEARRRLQARGFSKVTDLKKDTNGVWRGQAMHDGAATAVWVDYKGNTGAGAAQ